jgi:hypothetical protein
LLDFSGHLYFVGIAASSHDQPVALDVENIKDVPQETSGVEVVHIVQHNYTKDDEVVHETARKTMEVDAVTPVAENTAKAEKETAVSCKTQSPPSVMV